MIKKNEDNFFFKRRFFKDYRSNCFSDFLMQAMCFFQGEIKIIELNVAFANIAEGLTTLIFQSSKMLISWRDFPGIHFNPICKLQFYNELQA
jgi:hypothetical protein